MKKISKVLNKQYKKHFTIDDMEGFKLALENYISNITTKKLEESIKNKTQKFLENTFYHDYQIDTQDENIKAHTDQVIYNKEDKLNVLLEYKKLDNKKEMITENDINKKALHEICLYYFDAMEHNHNEIRNLVITNGLDFYIIDNHDFYSYFKGLKSTYIKFTSKQLTDNTHDGFYKEVEKYIIDKGDERLKDSFCYFNLKEESKTEIKLKNLYKVLHPNHLLKEYNSDDANSLNKDFYNELLYIIGLEEKKKAGVLLLEKNNNEQSLISLSMYELEDDLTSERKRYDVALELSLLWINRILFLKLVESYIVSINNSDTNLFFTEDQLHSFDRFNSLFFNVLGKREEERRDTDKTIFPNAPYLNSSLFELSDFEKKYLRIARLGNEETNLYGKTILSKDKKSKKKLTTPHYIVKFINAFDYSTTENSSDSTKQMINPAILGKVFEKINGYKDGAVFTPAFITEYMARVSIEKVIVNKFKEVYEDESIQTYEDVYNIIDDKHKANDIINSIKICDPSVGSGHFLVACLNEILRVKSELRILLYTYDSKKIIRDYTLHIENDDLVVEDDDGEIFTYKRNSSERQAVQEALFREKRIIIENCLFGVDLNSKSVEICKLRLWIELLKSTYYHNDGTLETLPNIDINIKVGDALISEYYVQVDKSVLGDKRKKQSKLIQDYKKLVEDYKASKSKDTKRETNEKLTLIKEKIRSNVQADLFETDKPLDYDNALEWMLEFPETWDDQAVFKGFDLIIGNPPYIQLQKNSSYLANLYDNRNFFTHSKSSDIYALFYEQGFNLLNTNGGILCYVTSNKWLRANYGKSLRGFITTRTNPNLIIDLGSNAFDNVTVDTNILMYTKTKPSKTPQIQAQDLSNLERKEKEQLLKTNLKTFNIDLHKDDKPWGILPSEILSLQSKIEKYGTPLKDWDINIKRGILTGLNDAFIIDTKTKDKILSKCLDEDERIRTKEIFKPVLRGKDIKRYTYKWADLWLISTLPVLNINIDLYPAINKHLKKYLPKLKQTGKKFTNKDGIQENTRKKTNHQWFETQDPNAYYKEFEKEKILFPRIIREQSFILTDELYYGEATSNIITGEYLPYLLAFLNSNIVYKLFKLFYEGGGISGEIKLNRLEMIPIPKLDPTNQEHQAIYTQLTSYGTQMQLLHQNKQENQSAIITLDKKINTIIYNLYNFTPQEIKLLEKGI